MHLLACVRHSDYVFLFCIPYWAALCLPGLFTDMVRVCACAFIKHQGWRMRQLCALAVLSSTFPKPAPLCFLGGHLGDIAKEIKLMGAAAPLDVNVHLA